jgi:ATP-dependent RNA helicase RhlE
MIEVARRNAPADLVSHQVYEVPAPRKRALLAHLIRSREIKQVLVFVRMKRDANRLARELVRDGIGATAIHSDRTQAERELALAEFKEGKSTVLVATDIAARGLDIEELPFVVNYELPYTAEDYVHRIGRTGRAGLPGEAISLVSPEESKLLADVEKLLKRTLPRVATAAPAFNHASAPAPHRPRSGAHERHERKPHPTRGPSDAVVNHNPESAFDFSKPYEPAPETGSRPSHAPLPGRNRPQRPTAALLGGGPTMDSKHKK